MGWSTFSARRENGAAVFVCDVFGVVVTIEVIGRALSTIGGL